MSATSAQLLNTEVLARHHYLLKSVTCAYVGSDSALHTIRREVYDRGDGAAILLYDPARGMVLLTRQFRVPAFVQGDATGMLIEACAGMLDADGPEDAIRREAEEETGYRVGALTKVCEAYSSPGAVTELIHYYVAAYDPSMRVGPGGGLADEQEDIEVLELPIDEALGMIGSGGIRDAKTIVLLQHVRLAGLV